MKLASLNGKNDIDVIVNQFFRQLPKRWMLLQQEREDCRLARKNLIFHILHIIDFQNQSKCTSKCIENARLTSKPGWGHLNKQTNKKIIRVSASLICCQLCRTAAQWED